MVFPYLLCNFCNMLNRLGFSAADINISADRTFHRVKFCFCFIDHREDFFRTLPQNHTFRG